MATSTNRYGAKENEVTALLCCDHYSTDVQGKPSYIGVFEKIMLESFPGSVTRFFFVAQIRNLKGRKLSAHLHAPGSPKEAFINLGEVVITDEMQSILANLSEIRPAWDLQNLPFQSPGTYILELLIDDHSTAHLELQVITRQGATDVISRNSVNKSSS